MRSAAARVAAPGLAVRFDADSRAFHAAIARDRTAAVAAAGRLAGSARALADAFAAGGPGGGMQGDLAFAIVREIAGSAILVRFTDYEGSVQAVIAVDTLLNVLFKVGRGTVGPAAGIRCEGHRDCGAGIGRAVGRDREVS